MKARIYTAVKPMWKRGMPSSKKLCCTRRIRELIGPTSTSTNEVSYLNKSGLLDLCLTPYQAKVNKTGLCRNDLGQHFLDLNLLLMDFPTVVNLLPRPCKFWCKAQLWSCTEQTNLLVCSQNWSYIYFFLLNSQHISRKTIPRQWQGCLLTLERLEELWVELYIFDSADGPNWWSAGCVWLARTEKPICCPFFYSSTSGEYLENQSRLNDLPWQRHLGPVVFFS